MPGCLVHCWTKFSNNVAQVPSGSGNNLSAVIEKFLTTKEQIVLYEENYKEKKNCF